MGQKSSKRKMSQDDASAKRAGTASVSNAIEQALSPVRAPDPSDRARDIELKSVQSLNESSLDTVSNVLFTRVVAKGAHGNIGTQAHRGLSFSGAMGKQHEHDGEGTEIRKILGKSGMEDLIRTEQDDVDLEHQGLVGGVKPRDKRLVQLGGTSISDNKVIPRTTYRYNSTSTLFVDDTLHSPNPNDLLRCVATAMFMIVKEGERTFPKTYYHVFSEDIHPIAFQKAYPEAVYATPSESDVSNLRASSAPQYSRPPTVQDIYKFCHTIFISAKLTPECAVVFLIYIERLLRMSGMTLDRTNWKLEREILKHLAFTVTVKASEYATYYFELRSLSEELRRPFTLRPLGLEDALKFEARTFTTEETLRTKEASRRVPRVSSMEEFRAANNK